MTTVAYGPEQLRLVLNGHTVEGWADVGDFFMPPQTKHTQPVSYTHLTLPTILLV